MGAECSGTYVVARASCRALVVGKTAPLAFFSGYTVIIKSQKIVHLGDRYHDLDDDLETNLPFTVVCAGSVWYISKPGNVS